MITNLFSVFDPSSHLFSSGWLILFLICSFLTLNMWILHSPTTNVSNNIVSIFNNEISFSLNNSENSSQPIIILAFLIILLINFVALYPQVFSATSHLTITLPLSLTFWLTVIIFGWANNTKHILTHLVPQGTPGSLMMFMVIIEIVSNLIRPITLCVRLTANLIAGHLLISLLGNFLLHSSLIISSVSSFIPPLLSILEAAVACIQAYVFMTLITLYTTEVN